jgi:hypothetical protein
MRKDKLGTGRNKLQTEFLFRFFLLFTISIFYIACIEQIGSRPYENTNSVRNPIHLEEWEPNQHTKSRLSDPSNSTD